MGDEEQLTSIAVCNAPCCSSSRDAACRPASAPGPRAWIDDPLDGAYLPLAPVVVQSHASWESGTASAALLVNGAQVRVDNATNASDPLASFAQPWEPAAPGDYTLEVVATDTGGNTGRSNPVLVHVSAQPRCYGNA